MQGRGEVEPDEEVLEDGIAFAGVAKFPARVKCALLAWMAWKDATAAGSGRERRSEQCHDQTADKIDLPEVDLEAAAAQPGTSPPRTRTSPRR